MIVFSQSLLWLHAKLPQWCPSLRHHALPSPAGSSVHGIHQARVLESVPMPFSSGLDPGIDLTRIDLTQQLNPGSAMSPTLADGSLPLVPPVY